VDSILQTIYDDDDDQLIAIALDEATGKIATCAKSNVRVYKPYGQGENALKVSIHNDSWPFPGRGTESMFSGHFNIVYRSMKPAKMRQSHYHGVSLRNSWWAVPGSRSSRRAMRLR
jgi:hypothetical protein